MKRQKLALKLPQPSLSSDRLIFGSPERRKLDEGVQSATLPLALRKDSEQSLKKPNIKIVYASSPQALPSQQRRKQPSRNRSASTQNSQNSSPNAKKREGSAKSDADPDAISIGKRSHTHSLKANLKVPTVPSGLSKKQQSQTSLNKFGPNTDGGSKQQKKVGARKRRFSVMPAMKSKFNLKGITYGQNLIQQKSKIGDFITAEQMKLVAAPSESLQEKFIYFYKPYNFETNTKRFMEFSEQVDQKKAEHLENLMIEQAYLETLEANQDDFGQITDHARKDLKREIFESRVNIAEDQGRQGWNEVGQFILENAKTTVQWALKQANYHYGRDNKKNKKKQKKPTTSGIYRQQSSVNLTLKRQSTVTGLVGLVQSPLKRQSTKVLTNPRSKQSFFNLKKSITNLQAGQDLMSDYKKQLKSEIKVDSSESSDSIKTTSSMKSESCNGSDSQFSMLTSNVEDFESKQSGENEDDQLMNLPQEVIAEVTEQSSKEQTSTSLSNSKSIEPKKNESGSSKQLSSASELNSMSLKTSEEFKSSDQSKSNHVQHEDDKNKAIIEDQDITINISLLKPSDLEKDIKRIMTKKAKKRVNPQRKMSFDTTSPVGLKCSPRHNSGTPQSNTKKSPSKKCSSKSFVKSKVAPVRKNSSTASFSKIKVAPVRRSSTKSQISNRLLGTQGSQKKVQEKKSFKNLSSAITLDRFGTKSIDQQSRMNSEDKKQEAPRKKSKAKAIKKGSGASALMQQLKIKMAPTGANRRNLSRKSSSQNYDNNQNLQKLNKKIDSRDSNQIRDPQSSLSLKSFEISQDKSNNTITLQQQSKGKVSEKDKKQSQNDKIENQQPIPQSFQRPVIERQNSVQFYRGLQRSATRVVNDSGMKLSSSLKRSLTKMNVNENSAKQSPLKMVQDTKKRSLIKFNSSHSNAIVKNPISPLKDKRQLRKLFTCNDQFDLNLKIKPQSSYNINEKVDESNSSSDSVSLNDSSGKNGSESNENSEKDGSGTSSDLADSSDSQSGEDDETDSLKTDKTEDDQKFKVQMPKKDGSDKGVVVPSAIEQPPSVSISPRKLFNFYQKKQNSASSVYSDRVAPAAPVKNSKHHNNQLQLKDKFVSSLAVQNRDSNNLEGLALFDTNNLDKTIADLNKDLYQQPRPLITLKLGFEDTNSSKNIVNEKSQKSKVAESTASLFTDEDLQKSDSKNSFLAQKQAPYPSSQSIEKKQIAQDDQKVKPRVILKLKGKKQIVIRNKQLISQNSSSFMKTLREKRLQQPMLIDKTNINKPKPAAQPQKKIVPKLPIAVVNMSKDDELLSPSIQQLEDIENELARQKAEEKAEKERKAAEKVENERLADEALKLKTTEAKDKFAEEQRKMVEKIKSTTSAGSKKRTFYSGRLFMHSYMESKNENTSGYDGTSNLNVTEDLKSERCSVSGDKNDTEASKSILELEKQKNLDEQRMASETEFRLDLAQPLAIQQQKSFRRETANKTSQQQTRTQQSSQHAAIRPSTLSKKFFRQIIDQRTSILTPPTQDATEIAATLNNSFEFQPNNMYDRKIQSSEVTPRQRIQAQKIWRDAETLGLKTERVLLSSEQQTNQNNGNNKRKTTKVSLKLIKSVSIPAQTRRELLVQKRELQKDHNSILRQSLDQLTLAKASTRASQAQLHLNRPKLENTIQHSNDGYFSPRLLVGSHTSSQRSARQSIQVEKVERYRAISLSQTFDQRGSIVKAQQLQFQRKQILGQTLSPNSGTDDESVIIDNTSSHRYLNIGSSRSIHSARQRYGNNKFDEVKALGLLQSSNQQTHRRLYRPMQQSSHDLCGGNMNHLQYPFQKPQQQKSLQNRTRMRSARVDQGASKRRLITKQRQQNLHHITQAEGLFKQTRNSQRTASSVYSQHR